MSTMKKLHQNYIYKISKQTTKHYRHMQQLESIEDIPNKPNKHCKYKYECLNNIL